MIELNILWIRSAFVLFLMKSSIFLIKKINNSSICNCKNPSEAVSRASKRATDQDQSIAAMSWQSKAMDLALTYLTPESQQIISREVGYISKSNIRMKTILYKKSISMKAPRNKRILRLRRSE